MHGSSIHGLPACTRAVASAGVVLGSYSLVLQHLGMFGPASTVPVGLAEVGSDRLVCSCSHGWSLGPLNFAPERDGASGPCHKVLCIVWCGRRGLVPCPRG